MLCYLFMRNLWKNGQKEKNMLTMEYENLLQVATIYSLCFLTQRYHSIRTQHGSLNPSANNVSQPQLDASDKQHVLGNLTGDKVPNSQLRVQIPKEVPRVCRALNPSTSTNTTIHKLLMSLSPQQIADSSCGHWSPSIWPLMGRI